MRLTERRGVDDPYPGGREPRRPPRTHRRSPAGGRLLGSPGPVAAACAALLVVLGAGAYAVRAGSNGTASGGTASGGSASGGPASGDPSATASRAGVSPAELKALSTWLATNVRARTSVVVPAPLVAPLRRAAPRLYVHAYHGGLPAAADLAVVTRSAPASARGEGQFPLARLAGGGGVEVRQLTGTGGTTVPAGEVRQLAVAGAQLAQNPRLDLPGDDVAALRAGEVDARLLVTLATLTARHDLTVDLVADPVAGPGSVAYREADIAAVDGGAVASDPGAAAPLLAFIQAQPDPFRPAEASVRDAGAATAFVLRYAVPIPFGLLDSSVIPTTGP